ncbi:hypothetical protein [Kumtagia ephedrae]|uniref:Uncharacterized protein n=1 Tax=Kumtagia ephedrae TaxID=2116701 RepID=A0A2P7SPY1_9HYPH|nr:hypothetical protein [Mesorhizobium ephedrae]PSJ64518.1 hypothetical protein C7I84_06130 [Mesorhizobium ephedrae]
MQDLLDALGIKGSILAAGLAGGVLRALSHRRFKFREMVASPICGALAAGYLTVPTLHYIKSVGLPLPPDDVASAHAAAFLIGVCAMWIADILLELVVRRLKPQADR